MTAYLHYDLLRNHRVMRHEDLVIGRTYLMCHVPYDNPYTAGVDPCGHEKKIIDVQFQSANDVELKQKEHLWRGVDPSALKRMWENPALNKKHWMFRTEEKPLPSGDPYINWHYCEDNGMDGSRSMNYLLDLEALADQDIRVYRFTSVRYVISEGLRLQREWEDDWIEESENVLDNE